MVDFFKYLISMVYKMGFGRERSTDIFFDLPNKEKQKILREVARESNKMQEDVIDKYKNRIELTANSL